MIPDILKQNNQNLLINMANIIYLSALPLIEKIDSNRGIITFNTDFDISGYTASPGANPLQEFIINLPSIKDPTNTYQFVFQGQFQYVNLGGQIIPTGSLTNFEVRDNTKQYVVGTEITDTLIENVLTAFQTGDPEQLLNSLTNGNDFVDARNATADDGYNLFVFGGPGNDTIYGSNYTSGILNGGSGDNELHSGLYEDKLTNFIINDPNNGNSNNTLYGSYDNNIYSVIGLNTEIIEPLNGGHDEVYIYNGISYTLPDNIEDLILDGLDLTNATQEGIGNNLDNSIFGNSNQDILKGLAGDDVLSGASGDDSLYGGNGHDTLFGGEDKDTLIGGNGHDTLFGEEDNDKLFGGNGNDYLHGGVDRDILNGGTGSDTLIGGTGSDIFVLQDSDFVVDFKDGEDFLRLGDRSLTYGNLTFTANNGNTEIYNGQDLLATLDKLDPSLLTEADFKLLAPIL